MCARASALRSSNSMRRRTTSRRNSMKCSTIVEQAQHARPAGDDRQQRDAVAHLQLRVLVEVVQHDVGQLAALELDDDPHALAARLVAQVGDAFDLLVADELGDLLDQVLLVDLIRDLGDDDRDAIAASCAPRTSPCRGR